MAKDIVADFVRRAREQHPEVPDMKWRKLEFDLRQVWGGERVYVVKDKSQGKAYSLAERLVAGESWREAMRAIGISRATAYRVRQWGKLGLS